MHTPIGGHQKPACASISDIQNSRISPPIRRAASCGRRRGIQPALVTPSALTCSVIVSRNLSVIAGMMGEMEQFARDTVIALNRLIGIGVGAHRNRVRHTISLSYTDGKIVNLWECQTGGKRAEKFSPWTV